MIRAEEESKRKKRRSWRARPEEGCQGFDCSPVHMHYILYKIYSLLLTSGELGLLGSLSVGLTVPNSGWHVHICTEQIEFHLCTDRNFRTVLRAELVWRLKISVVKLNLKKHRDFVPKLAFEKREATKQKVRQKLG